jgi:mycothiol synthase
VTALELREATVSDAAAVASLLNAISRAHHGEADVDADEILAWLREPHVQMVLAQREGELVGYGDVGWDERRPHMYWLDVRSLLGSDAAGALIEELERRAVPRVDAPVTARGYVGADDSDVAGAFSDRGYRVVRYAFRMRRQLDGAVEAAVLPRGLELRSYRPEDEERVYDATMDSFADHWEFARSSLEDWRRRQVERPGADTTLWQLAYDGDELAGVCLCRRYSTEEPKLGWVDTLGVRPPWRRRGLGRALLLQAFDEFERRGYRAVGLGVDGENTTGAVRLYERVGMHVSRRDDLYERTLA